MNQQAGKTLGVALLLAAAFLAALFAVTTLAPQPTDAQAAPLRNIIEVDGGRSSKMVFKVNPPATNGSNYLNNDDQIKITFPTDFALPDDVEENKLELSGSKNTSLNLTLTDDDVSVSEKTVTLTLPGDVPSLATDEHLVITIADDNGIIAPETPIGFDDPDEGYKVTITFVDTDPDPDLETPTDDQNIIVVKNPIDSTGPGDQVRIVLVTYADAEIGPGEEITVDFSGPSADSEFVVPSNVSNTHITIDPSVGDSFNPSGGVLVQGARVILTIPTADTTTRRVPRGEYEISFSKSAGIENPSAAGNPVIKVSSTASGDEEEDKITAVIRRTTTIDTLEGPRGTEFILTGRGYPKGTVTVYHDVDCDGKIDAGEALGLRQRREAARSSVDLVARRAEGPCVANQTHPHLSPLLLDTLSSI